jgi:hypothetical protein
MFAPVFKIGNEQSKADIPVCRDFWSKDKNACPIFRSDFVRQHASPCAFPGDGSSWVILNPIEQSIQRKIEAVGKPLREWDISIYRGILTGYNEAFIVDESKRTKILANCADTAERKRTDELIRPILRGRDIKRYGYTWADLYLIATHNGVPEKGIPRIDIKNYPAVKVHLDSYWQQIKDRSDQGDTPYNLRSCAYMEDFSKPKIVWGEISDKTKFALDKDGDFCNEATTFLMTGTNLLYLVCFLNSTLSEYLFSKIGTTTGVGTVRWKKYTIEQLTVPCVTSKEENKFMRLFAQLLQGVATESDINHRIYTICGLSPQEIELIENYAASI